MIDYSDLIVKVKQSIAVVFSLDERNTIVSKGSGFVFMKKGILVTCNHVVPEGKSTLLRFSDNSVNVNAKVVVRDNEHDIALVKFEDDHIPFLSEADVSIVQEGMPVIFSGFPLDLLSLTTHQGIISSIIKDATGNVLYMIDGTVNSGNSGCPLMTEEGKVIGVINAKRREQADLLSQVETMTQGAISIYSLDLVKIFRAIIDNLQLGIGYAVPSSFIPEHKTIIPETHNDDGSSKPSNVNVTVNE